MAGRGKQPPMSLDIQAEGDKRSALLLKRMSKRGADPKPAFEQISDELGVAEAAWFHSHGEGAWPKLEEKTLDTKQRLGYPSDPLIRTGALLRSLVVKRGRGSIRNKTVTRMRYGTRVPYAIYHYRARTGYSHVPNRNPLVPLDLKTRRRMVKDVQKFLLTDRLARSGTFAP